jgi:TetR/AcrR family transcriptional repressor of nem operon
VPPDAAESNQPDRDIPPDASTRAPRPCARDGGTDAFTCLAGTLAHEVHQSHPIAREAEAAITGPAATLENDVAEALANHDVAGDPQAVRESMQHFNRDMTLLCQGDE